MPARLIVNSDDFGLTLGINRSVVELHQARAITSTTLMAVGPAFADAVAICRTHHTLGVGCHLVFIDGSICDPTSIPPLADGTTRRFRPTFSSFVRSALLRSIAEDDLVREGSAQVKRLQAAGILVTHLDTHKHTHMLPVVARALLRVAEQCGVGAIRNPFEPSWSMALGHGGMFRRASVRLLHASFRTAFEDMLKAAPGIRTTDGTVGVAATGRLTRSILEQILSALPTFGTWELVVHPGYDDVDLAAVATSLRSSREIERRALLEVVPARRGEFDLIGYADL